MNLLKMNHLSKQVALEFEEEVFLKQDALVHESYLF